MTTPSPHETPEHSLLRRAIELAVANVRSHHGGPFAAIVARNGEVIAEGTNLVTSTHDPTAHAEVVAIRRACAALGSHQLEGCDIYTSCEPCPMCLGAIYWARPARVFFAATHTDAAHAGFDDSLIYDQFRRPHTERTILMQHVPLDSARDPFLAWEQLDSRIRY